MVNENDFVNVSDLKKYTALSKTTEKQLEKIINIHPMRVTKYYFSLINWTDKKDPIRKMIIPSVDELNTIGSYDTSGEAESTKLEGMQHKDLQTVLLLSTNQCSAYCRFCFRKRIVGVSNKEILNNFDEAIKYISKNKGITNVLISGGDPLTLDTNILSLFLKKLSKIKHLKFIRIGSRIPVVLPSRIYSDKKLLAVLKKYSTINKRIYIVTHFNHPREITKESKKAIDSLINSNVIINNQTVLMKGVNDSPIILSDLMMKLTGIGVTPYYIFQCRPVSRVKHHFQLPLCKSQEIIRNTRKLLSGPAKRFKFIMSHETGKIEILGMDEKHIYFKYHQSRNPENVGLFFKRKISSTAGWLDDF